MKKNIYKKGFTLIELLVVIAIFALIANVTMVALGKARRESRDTARVSDINQLRSALHLYSLEHNGYPDDDSGNPRALGIGSNLILNINGWATDTATPIYMYDVPRDPSMINKSASACVIASNDICDYGYSLNGNDFAIYFYLEGGAGNLSAGLHRATKDTVL